MAFFLLSSTNVSTVDIPAKVVEAIGNDKPTYTVHMTGYNAVPEQTNEDPTMTASGAFSNPDVVVARSRDLAEELPYGTIIEVVAKEDVAAPCGLSVVEHLIGYRVVADTMHPRKKNQIDIMFDVEDTVKVGAKKVNPAVALGVCDDIEIRVVGHVDIKDIPNSQLALAARVKGLTFALRE